MSPSKLLSRVCSQIPSNTSLLLAVSGGLDSMALLSILLECQSKKEVHLSVAHFNHKLRATATRDVAVVKSFCKENNLKFYEGFPAQCYTTGNMEQWARQQRYEFLQKTLQKIKGDWILTAHTLDDIVETLFIKLLSNKELSSITEVDDRRKVIRPLLSITRQELTEYSLAKKVEFIVDESNFDLSRLRNRIRHLLLPFIYAEFGSNLRNILGERAIAINDDIGYLHNSYSDILALSCNYVWGSQDWVHFCQDQLKLIHENIRWRFIESLFLSQIGFKVGKKTSQRILHFLTSNSKQIQISGNITFYRYRGSLKKCSTVLTK